MKTVLISDTHGFHRDPHLEIPDGDLLIHAGDLTMQGELDVLQDVNKWFGELHDKFNDIIVIAGNHDVSLGKGDQLGFKIFTNAIYLQNNSVRINDKLIWGCPDTPWKYHIIAKQFAFGKLRENMGYKGMPKDVDILVTHTPPYGILDLLAEGSSEPNTHIGDRKLLDLVLKYKPQLNVFGHIHEGYGVFENNDTVFVNASVVNEAYNLVNEPQVVYL